MKQVADQLTEDETHAVAAYFATQSLVADKSRQNAPPKNAPAPQANTSNDTLPRHGEVKSGGEPGAKGYFQPPAYGGYPKGPL